MLDVSASPDGVRSTRSLEGSTFTVSATKTTLELHDDPAILNGNVRYRQTHAGGTHTTGASAASMRVWVCGDLRAIDRVIGHDGVRRPDDVVLELTSSTPVGRARGFQGYQPSGHDGLAWPSAAQLKASPHGHVRKAGPAFKH